MGGKIKVSLSCPYHCLLKNTFLKIMSIETKDAFLWPFLFVHTMHSIFVKRVVTFGHGSLSICSCMSKIAHVVLSDQGIFLLCF